MKTARIFFLAVIVMTLIGCSSKAEDVFPGCYSEEKGRSPEIKIEKTKERYFVSLNENGRWSKPEEIIPATKEELSEGFNKDAEKIKAGLAKGAFGIFYVKKGALIDGEPAKSEYLLIMAFMGGGWVYKVDCED